MSIYSLYTNLHILSWFIRKESFENYGISEITALDIGQGDSFLIETVKNGIEVKILIDTGPQSQAWNEEYYKTGNIFSAHKLRKTIDVIMLSHDDADHAANFPKIMSLNKVGAILVSPYQYTYIDKNKAKINQKNIKIIKMVHGMSLSMPSIEINEIMQNDAFKITILHPFSRIEPQMRSANEHSLIGYIEIASTTTLFTGDAGINEESKLISLGLNHADILKVGHHGSNTSTSMDFLNNIRPYIAIISVGFRNSYGHPHKTTLKSLEKFVHLPRKNILRTDICGQQKITVYKNGALGRRSCEYYDKSIRESK